MSVKIQVKRASAASWTSVNPILDLGEFGLESDTNKLKIGTGVAWNSTDYLSETYQLGTLQDVAITNAQNGDFLRYSNSASAWINDPVNLATDTVGNYVQSLVAGTGVTLSNNSGEGSTPTVAVGQDVATSASVTFAAVTAPLVGNASTATTLQTARNIAGQSFNGSADISIAPTDLTGVTATAVEINVLDGITSSTAELNILDGVTASASELNILDGVTASASELNILDGATLSTTELNYVDGVTSAIQTQIDTKAPINSPTFTGTVTLPNNTVALGTQTTGDYVSSLVAGTGLTITNNSGEGATPTVAIGQSVATSASPTFGSLSTTGALYVGTDIHVGGVYYTTTETNLAIEDSFIYLNDGNTVSNPDLGIVGNYNDGTYAHAGVFNDASDNHKWKFFKGYTPEPTDPINTSHASYTHADVIANTFESKVATGTAPFTVASTTVVTNLNADLLDGNSSTYFLNGTTSVLDDISNVSASAPSNGQFLKYNGTAWVPDSVPTINALDDIGNVSASAPVDDSPLVWSSSASAWVANSQELTLGEPGTTDYLTISATSGISMVSASEGVLQVTVDQISGTNPDSGPYFLLNANNLTFSNGSDSFMIDPYWATSGQVLAFTPGSGSGGTWGPSNVVRDNLVRFYMEVM